MIVILLAAIVVLAFWLLGNQSKAAALRSEQLWELRFPTLDEDRQETFHGKTFVDFKEMVMVDETSDVGYHRARLFDLRRKADGTWEAQEQFVSWQRSRKEAEGNPYKRDWLKMHSEGPQPEPAPWQQKLEVAYQRFIHQYVDRAWTSSPVEQALAKEARAAKRFGE